MVFTAAWAGEYLVWTGSGDRGLSMWDLRRLPTQDGYKGVHLEPCRAVKTVQFAHEDSIWALSHCEGRLVSGGVDKLVKVWDDAAASDPASGTNAGGLELPGHQGPVFCTVTDQCNIFSGGSDGLVLVWDFHSDRGGSVRDIWDTGLGDPSLAAVLGEFS